MVKPVFNKFTKKKSDQLNIARLKREDAMEKGCIDIEKFEKEAAEAKEKIEILEKEAIEAKEKIEILEKNLENYKSALAQKSLDFDKVVKENNEILEKNLENYKSALAQKSLDFDKVVKENNELKLNVEKQRETHRRTLNRKLSTSLG